MSSVKYAYATHQIYRGYAMRWVDWPSARPERVLFYDLMDGDRLMGYVKEDMRFVPPVYTAVSNDATDQFKVKADTLGEAKAQLIHHFVLQRMENT